MNWTAIYWVAPGTGPDGKPHIAGQLISVGTVVTLSPAQLTANGWASKDLGATPPAAGTVWSPSTLAFVAAPNPPTVTAVAFIMRFTGAEWGGIKGAVSGATPDGNIAQFLDTLFISGNIDLTAAQISSSLTYLVNHGLLTAARATAIGTP